MAAKKSAGTKKTASTKKTSTSKAPDVPAPSEPPASAPAASTPPAPAPAPEPVRASVTSPAVDAWRQAAAGDEPTVDLANVASAQPTGRQEPDETLVFAGGGDEDGARQHRNSVRLRAGSLVRFRYLRDAADVGTRGSVSRIEMGYQFGDQAPAMAVVADGQRTMQGALLRREPAVRIPTDRHHEMQVWFRLDMEDGRVVWDSQNARNYRFPVGI